MKNSIITNYISSFNFDNEDWSVEEIKYNLKVLLGETPAVKVDYVKDVKINEIKGEAEEFKKMESITVIYTDTDNKIKKSEFRIGV